MPRRPTVQGALTTVLDKIPASIRQLSRDSGVPHSTLIQARDSEINLSPGHTQRVIQALRKWAETCEELAELLERADRGKK